MKSILAVSSILMISIASFFTQSEMNITFDAPTEVTAGESFILGIDIDKGDISNFAKLQLNLPEGFKAELFDGKGGTFTFYDQKMKLIWISLPSDEKFNVKIKITTEKSIAGSFNFNGKVSFVVDGDRKSIDLITPNFNVSPNANAGAPNKADPGTTSTDLNTGGGSTELTCTRSFDASQIAPGGTFLVELKVKKSNVSGVGKIIENIPEGFTAQEVEANGAIFSQKGSQVKFLWMTLPASDDFIVSYKVAVDESLSGNKVIDGKMSYLDGSDTKNYLIDGTSIEITSSPNNDVAVNSDNSIETSTTSENTQVETNSNSDENTDNIETSTTSENTSSDNESSNNTVENNTSTNAQDNSSTETTAVESETETASRDNSSNHQVNYRVQICALRKQVPTSYFVQNHNVNEHIYLNMHEGWHKYTVGDFKKYMSARAHRDVAKNSYNIKGSFVTAYNNGTRITVQEALMITNDEWKAPTP